MTPSEPRSRPLPPMLLDEWNRARTDSSNDARQRAARRLPLESLRLRAMILLLSWGIISPAPTFRTTTSVREAMRAAEKESKFRLAAKEHNLARLEGESRG
ncbi:hypothetical protein KM043_003866 [Ampulex compressa]|nr:hypothetical protein KM043_003866 [Ampulex compressa]